MTCKPVTAWAAITPGGAIEAFAVGGTMCLATVALEDLFDQDWESLQPQGWQIRRVRIEVEGD